MNRFIIYVVMALIKINTNRRTYVQCNVVEWQVGPI